MLAFILSAIVFQASSQPSGLVIEAAINDYLGRAGNEYKIPVELRGQVSTWIKLLTCFDHSDLVFVTNEFPSRIVFHTKKSDLRAKGQNASKLARALSIKLHKSIRFQSGLRDTALINLKKFQEVRGLLEYTLVFAGLPKALARLPMIESSFETNAESSVGAVGPWQLMPHIASKFISVSPENGIDERKSLLKSTVGAAHLFKSNAKIIKHWPGLITAYHSGMNIFQNSPERRKNESSFFQAIGKLGPAGKSYLASFMAYLVIETYSDTLLGVQGLTRSISSISNTQTQFPIMAQTSKRSNSSKIAKQFNVSKLDFIKWNGDLISGKNSQIARGTWVIIGYSKTPHSSLTNFLGAQFGDNNSINVAKL